MIYFYALAEAIFAVAAVVAGLHEANWAKGCFYLIIVVYMRVIGEAREAELRRQLHAKARGERPQQRNGLPWASYYLLVVMAIGASVQHG
jgi:hypothetical protein